MPFIVYTGSQMTFHHCATFSLAKTASIFSAAPPKTQLNASFISHWQQQAPVCQAASTQRIQQSASLEADIMAVADVFQCSFAHVTYMGLVWLFGWICPLCRKDGMGIQELLELCFPFDSRAEIKILTHSFCRLYVLCTSRYIKKKFIMGSISVTYS